MTNKNENNPVTKPHPRTTRSRAQGLKLARQYTSQRLTVAAKIEGIVCICGHPKKDHAPLDAECLFAQACLLPKCGCNNFLANREDLRR